MYKKKREEKSGGSSNGLPSIHPRPPTSRLSRGTPSFLRGLPLRAVNRPVAVAAATAETATGLCPLRPAHSSSPRDVRASKEPTQTHKLCKCFTDAHLTFTRHRRRRRRRIIIVVFAARTRCPFRGRARYKAIFFSFRIYIAFFHRVLIFIFLFLSFYRIYISLYLLLLLLVFFFKPSSRQSLTASSSILYDDDYTII